MARSAPLPSPSAEAAARPRSISPWGDPLVITPAIVLAYLAGRDSPLTDAGLALFITAVTTAVMCLLEWRRAPWRSGASPAPPPTGAGRRAFVAWVGAVGLVLAVLFGWWVLAEYRRPYYRPLFEVLPVLLAVGLPLSALGLLFAERRLGPAESGTRELGRLLLGGGDVNRAAIRDEFLALAVKGFFLPINFCELSHALHRFRGVERLALDRPWPEGHAFVLTMLYALIIAAVTPGYLFHSRLFRTEVRKIDASWFGWAVTLGCYSPFVAPVFDRWFNYHPFRPGPAWQRPWTLLAGEPHWLMVTVGALILATELLHYWGEVQFGLRSSNLTHRGIITDGPYRFCKHPVYLIKCVGWALIWMPFLAGGTPLECLRLTLLFGGVCGIYLMRGWVEERLLSDDPDYVAYALWIDRHGLFAWAGRRVPPLSFRWRRERWAGAGPA